MTRKCSDEFRGARCELPADHEADLHRRGSLTWMFTDTLPEWRRRATADYRARGFVAVKETER